MHEDERCAYRQAEQDRVLGRHRARLEVQVGSGHADAMAREQREREVVRELGA